MNKYNMRAPFRVKLDNSVEIQVLNGYSPYKLNQDFSVGLSRQAKNSFKIYPFSSIAIFNLSDFQESGKETLERELDLFFKRVNSMNIRNIFYDLSMNQGGDFDTFYSAVKALNIVKHGTIAFSIDKTERVGLVNRKYRLDEKVLQPNTTNIQIPEGRKLFVIQGINTMSVGDYFCRIVAANKLGTLVGQNSGEPTVAFSCSFYHTMSNSKISFSIATALLDFSDYFKHETLHPDVYWDVNNSRKFSEEELNDIIKHCMK